MRRLRPLIERQYGHSWATAAGLALLMLLIYALIDNRLETALDLRNPPWCVIPVFAGVVLLNGRQESLLALLYISLELQYDLSHRLEPMDASVEAMFLRRSLILLVCVWASHVNGRLLQQRQQLQASETALRQKLQQSLRAAALAHELRQPLSQLLIQARLIQHRFEQEHHPAGPLTEGLTALQASGQQLDRLVRAIGALLNRGTAAAQPVNLAVVVNTCLKRLRPDLHSAGVELEVSGLRLNSLVEGQGVQLEICCCNLLRNALEALTNHPGPRRLRITLEEQASRVMLSVADNGPGLPSEQLSDLVLNSSKPEGMGIGLLTAQSIASSHGGALRLGRSRNLGGAELLLSLPSARPDTAWPAAPVRPR